MTGNDDLFRRIEIHCFHHLPLGTFIANSLYRGGIQAEDGGHGALAGRYGLLHSLGAQFHQRNGIGEAHYACRNKGRVFTQAVTGDPVGYLAALVSPQSIYGYAGRQHQRLRIHGLAERFGRPISRQLPQVATERFRGLVKGLTNDLAVAIGSHHAQRLRTLSGKYKREFHVLETDQNLRRTAPQVKPPPTPSSIKVSPRLMRPSRTAASSASGIEAAEVLPWRSTVVMTFSIGRPSFFAVDWMMRIFA